LLAASFAPDDFTAERNLGADAATSICYPHAEIHVGDYSKSGLTFSIPAAREVGEGQWRRSRRLAIDDLARGRALPPVARE